MSSRTLIGVDPTSPAGQSIYLSSRHAWWDMVAVIDTLLWDRFAVNDDAVLEYLEDRDAKRLASLIDEVLADGSARDYLDRLFTREEEDFPREDDYEREVFINPDTGQPIDWVRQRIEGRIDGTLEDLKKLSSFLKSCGGFLTEL